MSDIPDGADIYVATMAIAWEMSKKIISIKNPTGAAEEIQELWLKIYEEVFKKIRELATG